MIMILSAIPAGFVANAQLKILSREQLRSSVSPEKSADSSSLAFRSKTLDGIEIKEDGGVQRFSFQFVNKGDKALAISAVTGNCTCIKAYPAKQMVLPGEESEIYVDYNPVGHSGHFRRRLLVYTSGDKPAAILEMNMVVHPASDSLASDYPVRFGSLRLRRSSVGFCRGVRAVESLRLVNAGTSAITVSCETAFLPQSIKVSPATLKLEPGEYAALSISYEPRDEGEYRDRKYELRLRGTGVSPRNAVIELNINVPK